MVITSNDNNSNNNNNNNNDNNNNNNNNNNDQIRINHLLLLNDLKLLYGKNNREIESLVIVRVYSKDIATAGVRYSILKTTFFDGIKLPESREIPAVEQVEGYKYLGVPEAGDVLREGMKAKLTKECFHRIRSIAKSKNDRRQCCSSY